MVYLYLIADISQFWKLMFQMALKTVSKTSVNLLYMFELHCCQQLVLQTFN